MSRPLLALLLLGCTDSQHVDIQGVVLDGWHPDAPPASGVTVRTLDEEGAEIDTTLAADNGWFRLAAAPGVPNVVVIEGEGQIPTAFQGNPGLNPRFRIPNGDIFVVSEARWAEEVERWEGCPGLDAEGGVVLARAEFDGFVGGDDGEVVIVESASAELRLNDGRVFEGCYLGEEGVYDPLAFRAGETGYFLFAGLPPGGHILELTYEPVPRLELRYRYEIRLPPGAHAPQIPLLVPFEAG